MDNENISESNTTSEVEELDIAKEFNIILDSVADERRKILRLPSGSLFLNKL